jgi:hypothetical protein
VAVTEARAIRAGFVFLAAGFQADGLVDRSSRTSAVLIVASPGRHRGLGQHRDLDTLNGEGTQNAQKRPLARADAERRRT